MHKKVPPKIFSTALFIYLFLKLYVHRKFESRTIEHRPLALQPAVHFIYAAVEIESIVDAVEILLVVHFGVNEFSEVYAIAFEAELFHNFLYVFGHDQLVAQGLFSKIGFGIIEAFPTHTFNQQICIVIGYYIIWLIVVVVTIAWAIVVISLIIVLSRMARTILVTSAIAAVAIIIVVNAMTVRTRRRRTSMAGNRS